MNCPRCQQPGLDRRIDPPECPWCGHCAYDVKAQDDAIAPTAKIMSSHIPIPMIDGPLTTGRGIKRWSVRQNRERMIGWEDTFWATRGPQV